MILVVPFANLKEWQIFFSFSSKSLLEVIKTGKIKKAFFLFPGETVVFEKINKKIIENLNNYVKDFFSDNLKNFLKNPHISLLLNEADNLKNISTQVLLIKPTFFYERKTLHHFLKTADTNEVFFVYPLKVSSLSECLELVKAKGIPFYYFLKNEFYREFKKKKNEYIYLTNRFLYIRSRDYHPILFNTSSLKKIFNVKFKRKSKKIIENVQNSISQNIVYDYQLDQKDSFVDKVRKKIESRGSPFYDFYTSPNYQNSILYKCLRKIKR